MRFLTHLNSLQAVESALRNGSLKAAAEELGITPAAVGQRIRALEEFLGTPLLVRGRHSFSAAPALQDAFEHLGQGFEHLNSAAELLQMRSLNVLRIDADDDWADLWLKPRLEKFRAENPAIEITINSEESNADFRVAVGSPAGLTSADVLYTDYCVPVAMPDLERRLHGFPAERQLEGLPLLHLDLFQGSNQPLGWPEWVARFGHRLTGAERGSRYRRVTQALDAVRSNSGFLICGLSLVADELAPDGILIPFAPREGAWMPQPYLLVSRSGILVRPQARRFREWLLGEAATTAVVLSDLAGSGRPSIR